MTFTNFTTWLILIYIVYYIAMILNDILRLRKLDRAKNDGIQEINISQAVEEYSPVNVTDLIEEDKNTESDSEHVQKQIEENNSVTMSEECSESDNIELNPEDVQAGIDEDEFEDFEGEENIDKFDSKVVIEGGFTPTQLYEGVLQDVKNQIGTGDNFFQGLYVEMVNKSN